MQQCLTCGSSFKATNWECPNCFFTPPSLNGFLSFANPGFNDGFNPDFFEGLAQLETNHFWFKGRNLLILHFLKRFFPSMQNFLEIGCGTGFVLKGIEEHFPATALYGSEYFHEGLSFAADRIPRATLYQIDARSIPFIEEYDVIGAFDVLEHIDEDRTVLSAIHKALNPGGGVVITVPQHRWLWSSTDSLAHHKRRYTRSDLAEKVSDAGFKILHSTSFVTFLLPFMITSRLLGNQKNGERDPLAELRLNKSLNMAFSACMSLERILIQNRVQLPVGGSLLLVAQKH